MTMLFRRKNVVVVADAEAKQTLDRLTTLTDRLEDTTELLAQLVNEIRHDERGAPSDA